MKHANVYCRRGAWGRLRGLGVGAARTMRAAAAAVRPGPIQRAREAQPWIGGEQWAGHHGGIGRAI